MPRLIIKICGLSTPETLHAALDAGADMAGLVFFPKSPRHVSLDQAKTLADQARGKAEIVALTVDADDAALAEIVRHVGPDRLQLHGRETPSRAGAVQARFGLPVIKAIGLSDAGDLREADAYRDCVDTILFDAKPPRSAALPGGNGVPFDWAMLQDVPSRFMLSGGLSPENIRDALRVSQAAAVDVSSGVESAPGLKDSARIAAFIARARQAHGQLRASREDDFT